MPTAGWVGLWDSSIRADGWGRHRPLRVAPGERDGASPWPVCVALRGASADVTLSNVHCIRVSARLAQMRDAGRTRHLTWGSHGTLRQINELPGPSCYADAYAGER
jgi:hypothetical protein